MRVCYAGPVWSSPPAGTGPERGIDGAHSCNGIGPALVKVAGEYGIQLEQWNFWYTDAAQVKTADAYDGVILYDHSMLPLWEQVAQGWDWSRKLNVFICHIAFRDPRDPEEDKPARFYCEKAYKYADLIGCLEQKVADDFRKFYGDRSEIFIWPWGCRSSSLDSLAENPYKTDKKVALWCGRMGDRALNYLHRVFEDLPEFELHIVSITPEQYPEMKATLPGVYHGCFKYLTMDGYFAHADVALDLAIGLQQTAANTKVYEYLGTGLPVAYEAVTGSQIIDEFSFGAKAEFNDLEGYRRAIRVAAGIPRWRREMVAKVFRSRHSWERRAESLFLEMARVCPTLVSE